MAKARFVAPVFIGYDPREDLACRVAGLSLARHASVAVPVYYLRLQEQQAVGFYTRPIERRGHELWDPISGAPMTTEHAISRFLVPWVAPFIGARWALFVDGDVLFRADVLDLFAQADPRYAVQCVQHRQETPEAVKKGGQTQTAYARKNWSSVMLWNLDHPAHKRLRLREDVNGRPGRELHAFFWLQDEEIGALDPAWNHLVGVSDPREEAKLAHFTLGMPYIPGYEHGRYAAAWRAEHALLGPIRRPQETAA